MIKYYINCNCNAHEQPWNPLTAAIGACPEQTQRLYNNYYNNNNNHNNDNDNGNELIIVFV